MSNKYPDAWVILKISNGKEDPFYRILAGWYVQSISGDSWQLNSGITSFEEDGFVIKFHGSTGSVYHCNLNWERFIGITLSMFEYWIESAKIDPEVKIEHISFDEFKQEFNSK